jgi:putative alpha-1,2-mannosidase
LTTHVERSWVPSAIRFCFVYALPFMVFQIPTSMTVAQNANFQDKAHSIDPFMAADSGSNVFIGPTLPFGMVKPGPDMEIGENDANAGWAGTGNIRGFSQTHVSGTGGGAKYGNVLIQPMVGNPVASGYDSQRSEERPRSACTVWNWRDTASRLK